MYGSIHTHFESRYDTANDMHNMCMNFIKAGAKKVAVTEHGVFSSYEDLKETVAHIKSDAKDKGESVDFDIIPGVEGYFGETRDHLILIAKDYEGYLSLCKIISESNENVDSKGNPIITAENLKKNVSKGHLICTSACIAGVFGKILGLEKADCEETIKECEEKLKGSDYYKYNDIVETYETMQQMYKEIKPLKKHFAEAERTFKKTGDRTELDKVEQRTAISETIARQLEEKLGEYEDAVKKMKLLRKNGYALSANKLAKSKEKLEEILKEKQDGNTENECHNALQFFTNVFGKDNFYFEIQNHGLYKEKVIYNNLIDFAIREGHTKFIASNDIHVGVRKSDPDYETALLKRNVIKFTRFNTYGKESEDDREYTIKDDDELREMLLQSITDHDGMTKEEIVDGAIANIENVLSECAIEFPKDQNHYPRYCEDEDAEFERRVREGLKLKFPNGFPDEEKYNARLEYELNVIKNMGYSGYHLIVADYLRYGRLLGYLPTQEEIDNAPLDVDELDRYITEKGYSRIGYNIGPGRGSGVGSICCYGLGITDIDPIPYDLLFERFLNVERVSMPDIDSDFRTDIRSKTIEYCKAKYGEECICQIMTKAYVADKGGIRLAARYLGSKYFCEKLETDEIDIAKYAKLGAKKTEESSVEEDTISDTFLEEIGCKYSKSEINAALDGYMKEWYAVADKLAKDYDANGGNMPEEDNLPDQEREIIKIANAMNGCFTNYGQHAAGTIISGDRLTDIIPLMWNEKKKNIETQCTMAQAESKGLLKMDFLGLGNLDIITEIIRNPANPKDVDGTLQDYLKRDEMLKDPAIYRDIFCTGLTQGVFQFESDGMKKMLIDFQPESFEDIILLVAAYRPGPLDYIPEIIASKWHEKDPKKYPAPKRTINIQNNALKEILESTYGCPIYQEQIMQICQKCAGFSLGEADNVRRAMSKKKEYLLVGYKKAFVYGDDIVNDKGETVHIPGCMKHCGMTEEEANLLFEQLMPFAKYGFNKSHATAYAMIAMFTAYLKKYHTADFFRVSLDYTKELKEIPAFVKEMPRFGLSLKGPSLMHSQNKFSVEDGGKSIRFGFKKIKGFSEQDIIPSKSIEEFMELNPDVTVKVLEKYVRLGFFKECWKDDCRSNRVHGNRHEILKWLEVNGSLFADRKKQQDRVDELAGQLEPLRQNLSRFVNTEEEFNEKEIEKSLNPQDKTDFKEALKEYRKVLNQYNSWSQKLDTTEDRIYQNMMEDISNGTVSQETIKEKLENRAYEVDMLSIPFDVEESLQRVASSANTRSFANLKTGPNPPIDEATGREMGSMNIPAVVLSCTGPKTTKSGKSTYYEVSLMDRNRNIITRRFDEEVKVLDGVFNLTVDCHKYYTNRCRDIYEIKSRPQANRFHQENNVYVTKDASSETKIEAMKQGKDRVKRTGYWVNGKFHPLISVPKTAECESAHVLDDENFER